MPQLPPGQAALAVRQSQSSGIIWDRGREDTHFYDISTYLTKLFLDMNDSKLQTLD